ncbi:hypothetical protein [Citrobacter braakii]|uniref:hypothetical protein n=1 Tax=Citrobacter braakii TaxID=57706 RepID=UPI0032C17FCB
MNRLLIVDDDETRLKKVKELLILNHNIPPEFIDCAECVNDAKTTLRRTFYTIVFIDVGLPQLKRGDVDPEGGFDILKAILAGRLKTPGSIFGYTSLEEGILEKKEKYQSLGFDLLFAPTNDYSWLESIKAKILYQCSVFNNIGDKNLNIVVFTLHGIRTYGKWQERFAEICRKDQTLSSVESISYKHTSISTLNFLSSEKREKIVEEFLQHFENHLRNNRSQRIICIAHSFGTYILMNALKKIKDQYLLQELDLIILCGSVLDRNYDFDYLCLNKTFTLINECAVNDYPLAINEAFVPEVGLGGVTGFDGFSGQRKINRFHPGGHSSFFRDEFMEKNWLPLLTDTKKIPLINDGDSQSILYKLTLKLCKVIGKIKRKANIKKEKNKALNPVSLENNHNMD